MSIPGILSSIVLFAFPFSAKSLANNIFFGSPGLVQAYQAIHKNEKALHRILMEVAQLLGAVEQVYHAASSVKALENNPARRELQRLF